MIEPFETDSDFLSKIVVTGNSWHYECVPGANNGQTNKRRPLHIVQKNIIFRTIFFFMQMSTEHGLQRMKRVMEGHLVSNIQDNKTKTRKELAAISKDEYSGRTAGLNVFVSVDTSLKEIRLFCNKFENIKFLDVP